MPTRESLALTLPASWYDVPATGNVLHGYNYNTPLFAFFTLRQGIKPHQLDQLTTACQAIEATGLKPQTTAAHGGDFHQMWFGLWRRYSGFVFITKHAREQKLGAARAVEHLCALYDTIMGGRALNMLQEVDPLTRDRMAQHHRQVTSEFVRGMAEPAAAAANQTKKSVEVLESGQGNFDTNLRNRLGGMGTVLTVSRGEGTDFHFDHNDFKAHYTVVFVIGRRAILYFKALNRSVILCPGEVIYFQSWLFEHKLIWDPSDESTAYSAVFTAFTCKNAAMSAGLDG